jgi:hypothetical protein
MNEQVEMASSSYNKYLNDDWHSPVLFRGMADAINSGLKPKRQVFWPATRGMLVTIAASITEIRHGLVSGVGQ